MPIYTRKCSKCEHADELYESIHAASVIECPKCKQLNFEKIISNTSFRMNSLLNDNVSTHYK